jgi:hypothetical protein
VLFPEYNQDYQIKKDEVAGHVARMVDKGNSYEILVGKPKGKVLLRRSRRGWVDNINTDFREDEVERNILILLRMRTNGGFL